MNRSRLRAQICVSHKTCLAWAGSALAPALFLALALMLPQSTLQAQSETCVFYSDINSALYLKFPSTDYINGAFDIYIENTCDSPVGALDTGPLGYVRAPTQSAAAQHCSVIHSKDLLAFRDFTKYNSQEIWWCFDPSEPVGAGDGRAASSISAGRRGRDGSTSTGGDASKSPRVHTCETLVQNTGLTMTATYGLRSGIQCRRVGARAVGIQSVLDIGVRDAVDVYGYAEQGYELCFPQTGRIVLLDAATSPRAIVNVRQSAKDGFFCASLNRAGTVVLLRTPAATAPPVSPATTTSESAPPALTRQQHIKPGTYDLISSAIPLENCQVTPSTTLRLRAAPWGMQLGRVWEGRTVSATTRTRSWFKVMNKDMEGWIAAWLTTFNGGCSRSGPGHAALPSSVNRGKQARHLTGA